MAITLLTGLQCNLEINMLLIIDGTTLRCSLQKHVTCVLLWLLWFHVKSILSCAKQQQIKTTNILEIRNTHYYTLIKVINLILKAEGTDFFEIKKSMLIWLINFGTFPNAYGQRYC